MAAPSVVTAQVWIAPAEICATGPMPVTSTGRGSRPVCPLPTWPYSFRPQHFAPALDRMAQVWKPPALIATTPAPRPTGDTGVEELRDRPSPSAPARPWPQHLVAPSSVMAQAWYSPALIAATPDCRPVTWTGTAESVVLPSPSCPEELLPQHH